MDAARRTRRSCGPGGPAALLTLDRAWRSPCNGKATRDRTRRVAALEGQRRHRRPRRSRRHGCGRAVSHGTRRLHVPPRRAATLARVHAGRQKRHRVVPALGLRRSPVHYPTRELRPAVRHWVASAVRPSRTSSPQTSNASSPPRKTTSSPSTATASFSMAAGVSPTTGSE